MCQPGRLDVWLLAQDGSPIGFDRAVCREVLIKAIVFGVIPLLPLINFLWHLWQDQHKALHDLICGTRVVEA